MAGTASIPWLPEGNNSSATSTDMLTTVSKNSLFSNNQGSQDQQEQNSTNEYNIFSMFDNFTDRYMTSTSIIDSAFNASTESPEADTVSANLMVPVLMFIFGVCGNILALIILTVKPSKDSKATAFYHLVKALVYMDLFGIVATSPVTIVVYLNGGIMKTGGTVLCHYFSFLLMLAGNATVFTVLVMAVERFLVSKFPFQYSRIVRPMVVNLTVGIVWGYSCLLAALPILGVGQNKAHWPETWCFFDYRNASIGGQILSYHYAASGLSAIIITIVLNITVIRYIWSMRKSRLHATFRRGSSRSQGQDGGSGGSGPDSEMRMVILLMAIIIVFSVCYAPLMVRIIMNAILNAGETIPPGGLEDKLDLWSLRLACLNQILDPWVYIISRVTCCKSQKDSAREPLRSASRARSISPNSTPSHLRRSTVTSSNGINDQPSPQWPRKQRSLVSRSLVAIRVLFKLRRPGKQYKLNHSTSKDPEMTSATPLQSSPVHQMNLAETSVSSRCDLNSRIHEDGIC